MILFFLLFYMGTNGWLAAVSLRVGFVGWLFGGMDSKPLCVPGMRIIRIER